MIIKQDTSKLQFMPLSEDVFSILLLLPVNLSSFVSIEKRK